MRVPKFLYYFLLGSQGIVTGGTAIELWSRGVLVLMWVWFHTINVDTRSEGKCVSLIIMFRMASADKARHRGEEDEQERRLLVSKSESGKTFSRDSSRGDQQQKEPARANCGLYRCGECTLTALLDPRRLAYGYMLVALLCLIKASVEYNRDMPAALERVIINVMRVTITQYELLYSLYSWPNVVLPVIGGILLDRVLGLRLGLIIFVSLSCLGQLLLSMGGYFNLFWLMVVGRFFYGAGTELTATTIEITTAALFRDRELSFVFGLVFGAGRIGSTLNLNLSHRLYDALHFLTDRNTRLGSVLLFGFGLCVIALVIVFILAGLHYRRERVLKKKREMRGQFKLKDLKDFSFSFWLITCVGLLYYAGVFPFLSIAQVFFEQKYGYRVGMANLVNGLLYLIPIVAYPLFGLIFDWTGYKLYWGMFSILGTQACHFALAFAGPEYFLPIISTLCLGLFYSMFTCSVWPQVFLLIQEHQLATAYGISFASYEFGQAVAPIILGVIVDESGYMVAELFFASVLALTFLLLVALYIVDTTYGGQKLNMSGRKRRRRRRMTRLKERETVGVIQQPDEEPVTEKTYLISA